MAKQGVDNVEELKEEIYNEELLDHEEEELDAQALEEHFATDEASKKGYVGFPTEARAPSSNCGLWI